MGRKGRKVRDKNEKVRHISAKKTKILRESGWKLNFPELFERIPYFPYIVRINDKDK